VRRAELHVPNWRQPPNPPISLPFCCRIHTYTAPGFLEYMVVAHVSSSWTMLALLASIGMMMCDARNGTFQTDGIHQATRPAALSEPEGYGHPPWRFLD
jgi:hypothetical protein